MAYPLQSICRVQISLGIQILFVSLLRGIKQSEMDAFFIYRNACAPSLPKFPDTKQSAVFVVGPCEPLILQVQALSNIAKVANTVVGAIAAYVVNVVGGPISAYMKPRKSMSKVLGTINANLDVSPAIGCAGSLSFLRSASNGAAPEKHTSAGVVVQQFAQARSGKIGLSHEALLLLIGQRPLGVDAPQRLRHFARRVG